jgi:hypothetical protein
VILTTYLSVAARYLSQQIHLFEIGNDQSNDQGAEPMFEELRDPRHTGRRCRQRGQWFEVVIDETVVIQKELNPISSVFLASSRNKWART